MTECTREDCLIRGGASCACGRYTRSTYYMGWRSREDGDIDAHDGFHTLEDFAAAGRIDGPQLTMAREIKRKYLARQAK